MDSVERKFGTPPPLVHPMVALLGQFVLAVVILVIVQPPFVCDGSTKRIKTITVVAIAGATTVACGLAHLGGATSSDIFRGVFETMHQISSSA